MRFKTEVLKNNQGRGDLGEDSLPRRVTLNTRHPPFHFIRKGVGKKGGGLNAHYSKTVSNGLCLKYLFDSLCW
ncbi:MAG: hypothetical protein COV68_08285 [Nitrospirae bacterium CG11_big_fil_rev_8_21_14_0_20_41_14]|nr:MAG: hypothetical protein COV68_08285 [Nitrospirae bacterium CG11_big_fil_rev_8_21_14_0_20_41_14]